MLTTAPLKPIRFDLMFDWQGLPAPIRFEELHLYFSNSSHNTDHDLFSRIF